MAETVVDIEVEVTLLTVRTTGPAGPVVHFCEPIGHHQSDGGGQARSAGQGDREGQSGVRQDRLRIGTDAEKGRMAQGKQSGKSGQKHQSQAGDTVNQNKSQLCQPVFSE